MDSLNKRYQDMALSIQNARKNIHSTFKKRNLSKTARENYDKACAEFYRIYHLWHINDHLYPDQNKLKQGDPTAIQTALHYLEADLYYFNSGYHKEFITSGIKKLIAVKPNAFTKQQLKQLESILLNKVRAPYCREFRYYCRLARVLLPSPGLQEQLMQLSNCSDTGFHQRAQWMLNYMKDSPSL